MDKYYELSLKVYGVLLEDVKKGEFPKNQLRMYYRVFASTLYDEDIFLAIAEKEYDKGQPMNEVNTIKAILGEFFDFPRSLYHAQNIFNKALKI